MSASTPAAQGTPSRHEAAVIRLIDAFAAGDKATVEGLLADDLVAHVTEPDGSTREVHGSAAYVAIIDAMDPVSANLRMDIPQITTIEPGLVMVMVEVHAQRYGKSLHNFSGQLYKFRDDQVCESWMVEALPAYSDEFWSTTPDG